jgi:hypothetical protein
MIGLSFRGPKLVLRIIGAGAPRAEFDCRSEILRPERSGATTTE